MNRPEKKECPAEEWFVLYISGELGEYGESRLLEHATLCPRCRLRLNALSSIQAELKTREKDIPEVALSSRDGKELRKLARKQIRVRPWKGGMSFPRITRAGGILAIGILLVILGYRLAMKIPTPEPITRGQGQMEIRLQQPEGKIREAPKVFSWSKVPDSDIYRLEIVDEDLNLVFSASLAGTRFHLPEDIKQKLERQKSYLWSVSAIDDDGRELGSASSYFEIESDRASPNKTKAAQ
jgi:hypothetical protein